MLLTPLRVYVKTCTRCGQAKPVEEFHKDARASDGRQSACKECNREYHREWREANREREAERKRAYNEANRERVRANALMRYYRLSLEAYDAMLASQNNGCAICGKTPEENGRALAVDHDHACCPGKRSCGECVRGLLCDDCNRAIGLLGDSADLLMSAIRYLKGGNA